MDESVEVVPVVARPVLNQRSSSIPITAFLICSTNRGLYLFYIGAQLGPVTAVQWLGEFAQSGKADKLLSKFNTICGPELFNFYDPQYISNCQPRGVNRLACHVALC